jgi:hypothetical protein
LALALLYCGLKNAENEPERLGVTPITLVVGDTTTY